jgi:NAD(P)-dependent dehydrogenase (short-subunit alcohol dehydrogenase family)
VKELRMKLGLQDKVAIVTGASKGIGLAVVEALCGEGAHVVAGARHSSPELDALVEAGGVEVVTVDLSEGGGPADMVLGAMLGAGQGSIVSISSVNALLPDPSIPDYCAAKAALSNFSKALSKEVGPHGIRVNTVSPGPVATDLWLGDEGVASTVGRASGLTPADVAQKAAGEAATGRFTTPSEVADLVLLLASDRTKNVTGADFTIDGGLTQTL